MKIRGDGNPLGQRSLLALGERLQTSAEAKRRAATVAEDAGSGAVSA